MLRYLDARDVGPPSWMLHSLTYNGRYKIHRRSALVFNRCAQNTEKVCEKVPEKDMAVAALLNVIPIRCSINRRR